MQLLEFFTGFITVFENPVWDWMVGSVLVAISSVVAYAIGGELGYNGKKGFILWLLTAIGVYAVIACIIRFIIWLISLPWWIWLIIAVVIIVSIVIFNAIVRKGKQNESSDKEEN